MRLIPVENFKTKFSVIENGFIEIIENGYADGSTAIRIKDDLGEIYTIATVCLKGSNLIPEPGDVFIKNWSENEGIYEELVKHGIVSDTVIQTNAGFCSVLECALLV